MSEAIKKIKPLEDRILLRGVSEMNTSVSGIIIPETASKDRPQKAEVLAVGPGLKKKDGTRIAMDVKVGDMVLVSKYAADEVKIEGEEYYIIHESSILAVLN
jgi:chaperonin GroES